MKERKKYAKRKPNRCEMFGRRRELLLAIRAVKEESMELREASEKFDVPFATLYAKVIKEFGGFL